MELKLLVAYIAAGASLISVLINVLLARSNQRSQHEHDRTMRDLQEQQEKRLKILEAQLTETHSEQDARRDYEYEARKRLYTKVEPVLFQLTEFSEGALRRIYSLGRTARQGNLEADTSWLSDSSEYYFRSTLYHLMAPMAAARLLGKQITYVDLTVEKSILIQYSLAKRLFFVLTDDFEFAGFEPQLSYDPNCDNLTAQMVREEPRKYWRQGVFVGWLERFVEAMLVEGGSENTARIKSFGEFENEWNEEQSALSDAAKQLAYLLIDFHPRERPVLWRALIAQSHIYRALLKIGENKLLSIPLSVKPLSTIPLGERVSFDWRSARDDATAAQALEIPFTIAERYLKKRLPELWEETKES